MPGQICWSYLKIFVLELQDSSRLTNIIMLRCNHGIVDFLWVWITHPSRSPQQDFNTFGFELSSSFLFSLPCVRSHELLQSFLIILGPGGFLLHERIAMKQQSRSPVKSAFKWASHINLTLHLSQHNGNRGIVQILVLLLLVNVVCCRIFVENDTPYSPHISSCTVRTCL